MHLYYIGGGVCVCLFIIREIAAADNTPQQQESASIGYYYFESRKCTHTKFEFLHQARGLNVIAAKNQ